MNVRHQSNQDPGQEFWCGCVAQRLASLQLKDIQIGQPNLQITRE